MGVPSERFVNPVDDNLLCGICRSVFAYPVVTDCGHTFCATCLKSWIRTSTTPSGLNIGTINTQNPAIVYTDRQLDGDEISRRVRCPTCRYEFRLSDSTDEMIAIGVIARPVIALRNFIGSFLTHCENVARGCTTVESLEVLESGIHYLVCPYTPVDCAGCGQTLNRIDLAIHQLGCVGIQAEVNDISDQSIDPCRSIRHHERQDAETQTANLPTTLMDQSTCTLKFEREHCATQTEPECQTHPHEIDEKNAARSSCSNVHREREKHSLYILNLSLTKLVYALRTELATTRAEVKLNMLARLTAATHGLSTD